MSNFARFSPPTIQLVHNTTEASKTRRGLGSWASDIASAAGSAETSVETWAAGAASAVETAAQGVATAAAAEADKIIDEIGDDLADIENAVMGLMDRVLDTIQDELNKWLLEAAGALDDLDIPRKFSLHLTTYCKGTANSTGDSNSTQTSCNPLFSRGEYQHSPQTISHGRSCFIVTDGLPPGGAGNYNATANNGTIFGFQPGAVLAKALGVFYVPSGAQEDIREPVDSAANSMEKLLQEAGNDLSSWSIDLLFIPIVAVFAVAAALMCFLLLVLMAATIYSLREREGLPPRVYSVCGTIAALATFFLLLGSVILTVISLVAWVVNLAVDVVGISISSGSKLKWMSWAAFFVMAFVTGSLKVEEFVADCIFWWRFIGRLLGMGKSKGGMREAMKGL